MMCSLMARYQRFVGMFCFPLQSSYTSALQMEAASSSEMFLQNYMVSNPEDLHIYHSNNIKSVAVL